MDVFDLVAKITLDSSEYEKKAKELADDADKGSGWGGKIVNGLGKVGKVGAVAFGAVGAAAVAAGSVIVKSAVDSYAEYEQLSGGVKKLFGEEASKEVMKYAENAYKTAGMSANEYMDTATSFSASLIKSCGDDTSKAAKLADVAMQSMSDNVNTFGGDIEGIKSAYQGFAKQNYTMLDNLKLGYGGTKSEMERLIKDANKYRKAQGKNADLTVDSFADIVEAIQEVQEHQGIAGTTANEAMTTISGAASATKAAWKNVTTAIAGGGDLKKAMKGLTESIFGTGGDTGLLNQVIPRVKMAFEGLADFIGQAAPLLAAKLPELVKAILPSVLSAATSVIKALAQAIPGLLKGIWESVKAAAPALLSAVKEIGSSVINWFTTNGGQIFEKAKEVFGKIKDAVGDAVSAVPEKLGEIITDITTWAQENGGAVLEKAKEIFGNIVDGIADAVGKIPDALAEIVSSVGAWVTEHGNDFLAAGQNILSWIVAGIKAFISNIKNGFADLVSNITGWVSEHSDEILNAGTSILNWIVDGIKNFIGNIKDGFVDLVSNVTGWVSEHGQDLLAVGQNILGWIASGIKKFIQNIWNGFTNFVATLLGWTDTNSESIEGVGSAVIDWITSGISKFIDNIKGGFDNLVSTIAGKINSLGENLKNIGGSIIEKIKGGVSGFMSRIKNGFNNMTSNIEDKVTSTAVTDKLKALGGKIVDGIAAGITGVQKIAEKIGTIINNAITNATSKTYNANVKIAAETGYNKGSEGELRQAKALHKPYLFNKSTIFGKYQGENLVAGEAGPEMLLGVNKLNAMLFESVQGGMKSMMGDLYNMMKGTQTGGGSIALQQEIVNVLLTYLPQLANMQVVLDSGVLAGAVAPGVDSALGGTAGYKRRYNA